jgi:hypothetical protein
MEITKDLQDSTGIITVSIRVYQLYQVYVGKA